MAGRVEEETRLKVAVGTAAIGAAVAEEERHGHAAHGHEDRGADQEGGPTATPQVQTSAPGVASGPKVAEPRRQRGEPAAGRTQGVERQGPRSGGEAPPMEGEEDHREAGRRRATRQATGSARRSGAT